MGRWAGREARTAPDIHARFNQRILAGTTHPTGKREDSLLNPGKCSLAFEEANFLEYTVGPGNVKHQVKKVDAITTWPSGAGAVFNALKKALCSDTVLHTPDWQEVCTAETYIRGRPWGSPVPSTR